uniref:Uncharacterized protein n=1 Tax=uncultured marine virus TaxID=186617 RepID=A0A0F7L3P3_9VIRU|nr:hypothetical protein [uncultured marine virus]
MSSCPGNGQRICFFSVCPSDRHCAKTAARSARTFGFFPEIPHRITIVPSSRVSRFAFFGIKAGVFCGGCSGFWRNARQFTKSPFCISGLCPEGK